MTDITHVTCIPRSSGLIGFLSGDEDASALHFPSARVTRRDVYVQDVAEYALFHQAGLAADLSHIAVAGRYSWRSRDIIGQLYCCNDAVVAVPSRHAHLLYYSAAAMPPAHRIKTLTIEQLLLYATFARRSDDILFDQEYIHELRSEQRARARGSSSMLKAVGDSDPYALQRV